ncbi:hypothetical protein D0865_08514 [Hortaea werneckii]|uniref:Thioredoxin reductase n=1 Tax=Hortaea werneckii TaxID=91943 RepID=A0A3M7C6I6_HORWE|nr:hypothetical protein D0865_08514 [Hortaea werneckii]
MPQPNGVNKPNDPLDAVDYDPIDHLNALFSHQSTLSSAPTVSASLNRYQNALDADLASLVSAQSSEDADSVRRIQDAKAELEQLFAKIEGVRERALETERTITEMTADIKRLDSTKRNLTLSMTALKRLQMLTNAYEQLRGLIQTRQYRDVAQLLQAVIQLMAHFKSYRSIDQIAALSRNVGDVQRELLEQVCEDFELAFAKGEVQQKRGMLSEACQVMDALGEHARVRLITWYCNTQLREYRQVFRGNDEAGSLDNISRRYSWFNRMLKTYDAEHASIFPQHWRVNEMLANSFCESTREDYKGILQRSMRRTDGQPPDVNLLLSCLQETLDFEHSLERRFAADSSRSSMDTITSGISDKRPTHGFTQAISEAFEPYLSIWVESQDKQLASLIPKYRTQPVKPPDEEFHNQLVTPSSTELFHQYRITFAQCAKLSTGSRLLELSQTFAKYLDAYSQQVLFFYLSQKTGGPSIEDAVVILNTADYCYQTTTQLEDRIKQRIDDEFKEKVDMQNQADAFMGVASAAVRSLVHKAEADCQPAWREMRNVAWAKMDSVGDQSGYVSVLLTRVRERSQEILRLLHKQQFARAYCDNLVDGLTQIFITNIAASKPISETGAEQMLLDSYVLKKGLSELATLTAEDQQHSGTSTATRPSALNQSAFTKRVNTSMARLDMILKTLQVRSVPPEGHVQAYLIHIRDRSEANFRKILELKGIVRKGEQHHLVELFNAHKASPSSGAAAATTVPGNQPGGGGLQASNPTLASLNMSGAPPSTSSSALPQHHLPPSLLGGGGTSSSASPTPAPFSQHPQHLSSTATPASGGGGGGLQAFRDHNPLTHSTPSLPLMTGSRFDPSHFGTALMNAARDAGDRFGSPAGHLNLGGGGGSASNAASRGASPPPSQPPASPSNAFGFAGFSLGGGGGGQQKQQGDGGVGAVTTAGGSGGGGAGGSGGSAGAAAGSTTATMAGISEDDRAPSGVFNENLKNFGKFFRRGGGGGGGQGGGGVAFARGASRPLRSGLSLPLAAASFYRPANNTAPLVSEAATASAQPGTAAPLSLLQQQTRNMHSKLVIIGSGPGGHTAAIYAARADLKPVMYEGFLALGIAAGGQLTTTDEVENFPGFKMIKGGTLMDQMRAQSEACGTEIVSQTVGKVDFSQRPFKYWLHPMGDDEGLEEETHTADSIIIATGAKARRLDLPGEEKYWGNGVSACAVCDGSLPIFREKPLVVIGGGDSAVEESVYLTKKASKVTVLVRRDVLRASKTNAKRLAANPKVEIKYNTQGVEVKGDEGDRGLMRSMVIKNNKTGETEEIPANGLFYAVGHDPATQLFRGQLKMDEDGYLITTPGTTETSVPGVFAAGDVQDKKYRQAVTSAGTGCMAALEAEKWLAEQEDVPDVQDGIPGESEVKKGNPEANGEVPEYRQNPLL